MATRNRIAAARHLALLALLGLGAEATAGRVPRGDVSLERIMARPDWIGTRPEDAYWARDGLSILFERDVVGCDERALHELSLIDGTIRALADDERGLVDAPGGVESPDGARRAFLRSDDVFVTDVATAATRQLTRTAEAESDVLFLTGGDEVAFRRGRRWLARHLASGLERELCELRLEKDPNDEEPSDAFLPRQQRRLFDHVRERQDREDARRQREAERRRADRTRAPLPFYLGDDVTLRSTAVSPSGRHVLVVLAPKARDEAGGPLMPLWVTESGDVETRNVRPKVGARPRRAERLVLLDLEAHEAHPLAVDALPGITEDPLAELRAAARAAAGAADSDDARGGRPDDEEPEERERPRAVRVLLATWNQAGDRLAVMLRSQDNKDRWIATVDLEEHLLRPLHRLSDPGWVNWRYNEMGWLPASDALWYLSEESGFSHLYLRRPEEPAGRRLTFGRHAVARVTATRDGRWLYHRANATDPGVYEVHRVSPATGEREQVTWLGGRLDYLLSPDETQLLLTHSRATHPPELWLQAAVPGAPARPLTDSRSAAFRAIEWTAPRFVRIPSSHGAGTIHGRLYEPPVSAGGRRRPAVVFIHGAGYLQNAHRGWSGYFREFMFHSLLARRGYVVLDLDYRGSAGYGRDWRTAIYRDMGGPELEDLRDGVDWLVEHADVDRRRVGAYGGSYGGFLVLMALFTEPDLFAAGAALRPVTDWAHYNDGYTANILNTPDVDPEAYRRSSPIEHAAGLRAPLLLCAPMLDDNVLFQDTVRLVQRLIELEKTDFETALYPVEAHAFREPSSWLDEYRRILRLFDENLW